MTYLALKHLHITLAVISLSLFATRAALALARQPWRQRWPVLRWLPHTLDAALLSAGVGLMVWSGQYPGRPAPWLAIKLVLLVAYILLGKQALQPDLSTSRRWAWLAGAGAAAAGMVTLALAKPSIG